MAYNINKTDGTLLVTIPNNRYVPAGSQGGVLDLTLYGRGKLEYGELWNENFVHLLENFADTTAPDFPQDGMLWFDTGTTLLKFWNDTGGQWESLVTSGAGASTFVNVTGDTMTGDLTMTGADINAGQDVNVSGNVVFAIPNASPGPEDSPGIIFTGDSDEAKIYVENEAPEKSTLIIQMSDNVTDDTISLRFKASTSTYPVEILRLEMDGAGGPGIMSMNHDDGTGLPGATAASIIFNEGGGDTSVGADIRFFGGGLITAGSSITMVIDNTGIGTGSEFQIAANGLDSGTLEVCAHFNETGGLFCANRAPSLTPPTGAGTGFADWFLGTGGNTRNIHFGSTNEDIDKVRAINAGGGGDAGGRLIVEGADAVGINDFVTKQQLDAETLKNASGPYPWTTNGQLVTYNHNLGVEPYAVSVIMQCTVSDAGYVPGNRIWLSANITWAPGGSGSNQHSGGFTVWHNSVNQIQLRVTNGSGSGWVNVGGGIQWQNKSTGYAVNLQLNRWSFYFRVVA